MADQNNLFPQPDIKYAPSKYSPPPQTPETINESMGTFSLSGNASSRSSFGSIQDSNPQVFANSTIATVGEQVQPVIFQSGGQYTQPQQPVYQTLSPLDRLKQNKSINYNLPPTQSVYQQQQFQQPVYQQNIQQNHQSYNSQPKMEGFDMSYSQSQTNQQGYQNYNQPNYNIDSITDNPKPKKINPIIPLVKKVKDTFLKFKIPIIVSAILIVALVGGLIVFSQINKANTKPILGPLNNIQASIEGPKSLPQGSPGKWEVKIINNENTALQDLTIDLEFDKDFQVTQFLNYQPINVGKNQFKVNLLEGINGQNNILIGFEGFLNAQVDLETIMQGKLSYTPKLLSGQPNAQRQLQIAGLRTKIISPEIKLTIDTSNGSIQNGGEGTFIIKVKNTKEKDLQDLRLRMIYPAGNVFTYVSSQFVASNTAQNKTNPDNGDDTWYIPRLAGLTEQTLTVKGVVRVKSAQKIPFGTELSLKSENGYKELAKAYRDLNVTSEPIAITTTIDKSGSTFSPGETLKFAIDYVNQGQDLLKNVEILGFVDDVSSLLDYESITFVGGSRAFTNNNQIQWIGNNTPQLVSLAPQARGRLNYTIKVKQKVLDPSKNQSEYVLRPQVKIKASNLQEISSAGQLYKMKSNLRFSQTGKAEEIPQKNPTKKNLKRYLVSWQVKSEQNEIDGLQVRAFTRLPPSVWQSDSIRTEGTSGSNIDYNPNTGEITWRVEKIPAYTGNNENTPTIKVSFEMEVEIKNNENITLIEAPVTTARDNFTGENFNIKGKITETRK